MNSDIISQTLATHQKASAWFDSWAEAGRGDSMARNHWPMTAQILTRMALQPGMRCLDVGCGNGYAVRAMAERVAPGGSAVGVDVSPAMIARALTFNVGDAPADQRQGVQDDARTLSGRDAPADSPAPDRSAGDADVDIGFQVAAADALPFADESFDRVLSVEALYYMSDPLVALREWVRVLKSGGSLWVMVNFYAENPYSVGWDELIDLPMHYLPEAKYRDLLERAGLTAVGSDRLLNPMPLDLDFIAAFKPGWGYESINDVRRFRTEIGSLLVHGKKSSLDIED